MQILVFRTNLDRPERISDIESTLDIHPNISSWNIDRNDSDNVLRIVTEKLKAAEVEQLILGAGYYCEELG